MACDKRGFGSKKAARQSVDHMHESVRVYFCGDCKQYHNTKERNGKVTKNSGAWGARAQRGYRDKVYRTQNRENY